MTIKKIVGRDVLIYYPNFRKMFIIHADYSTMQIGRVMSSNWDFHFLLLTQVNLRLIKYTTKARKLPTISETQKIVM